MKQDRSTDSGRSTEAVGLLPAALFTVMNGLKIALFSAFVVYFDWELLSFKTGLSFFLLVPFYFLLLRSNRWLVTLWYCFQLLYLGAQLSYFFEFHRYLHILQAAQMWKECAEMVQKGALILNAKSLVLLVDLPFLIVWLLYADKSRVFFSRLHVRARWKLAGLCLVGSLAMMAPFWRFGGNIPLWIERSGEVWTVKYLGTVGNAIVQFFREPSQQRKIDNIPYGKSVVISGASDVNHPNIILMQMESIGADAIHMRFEGMPVMPFLDSLSGTCLYYRYLWSTHGAGSTSDIDFSVLNSVYPTGTAPMLGMTTYDFHNAFAAQLKPYYLKRIAFHNNKGQYLNREIAYPKMGFDSLYDMMNLHLPEIGWGAPDHQLFKKIIDRIGREPEPFLYYIVTMSTHEPYTNVPRYYREDRFEKVKIQVFKDFLNSMAYFDREMAVFLREINSKRPNTSIILFGDHCPPYISEKQYPDVYIPTWLIDADQSVYEFTPLLIISPDVKAHMVTDRIVSMIEIAPTVLAAAKGKFTYKTDGENLLRPDALSDSIRGGRKMVSRKEIASKMSRKSDSIRLFSQTDR